jgi:hypothetical protein
MDDPVNHPAHYTSHPSGVEAIDITRHMNFNLGNAVKYIWRAGLKGDSIEDLQKARFYISDELERLSNVEAEDLDQGLSELTFKTCTSCTKSKALGDFGKNKNRKDGLSNRCKVCVNAHSKQWAQANPEKVKSAQKKFRKNNPDHAAQRAKAWRDANPQKVLAYQLANPRKAEQ